MIVGIDVPSNHISICSRLAIVKLRGGINTSQFQSASQQAQISENVYSPFHCFWPTNFCPKSVNMEPIDLKFEMYHFHKRS